MTNKHAAGSGEVPAARSASISPQTIDVVMRLQRDVEQLACFDQCTSTLGERRSAEWIVGRLSDDIAATDVMTTGFRNQSLWAPVSIAYMLAAMGAAAIPGILGRLSGAALTASYEVEFSGRNRWIRRLLPAKQGVTVTARIPAVDEPRHTVVLVAHHDAAHNGVIWHPRAVALNKMLSQRIGQTMPAHFPQVTAIQPLIFLLRRRHMTGVRRPRDRGSRRTRFDSPTHGPSVRRSAFGRAGCASCLTR